MDPQQAHEAFNAISDKGPWGLAIFLVLVNIATGWFLFRFFTGQLTSKDVIIKAFSDAWNRRIKADNARTEMEALQFAARSDLHPELKTAANQIIQKIKENEDDLSNQR